MHKIYTQFLFTCNGICMYSLHHVGQLLLNTGSAWLLQPKLAKKNSTLNSQKPNITNTMNAISNALHMKASEQIRLSVPPSNMVTSNQERILKPVCNKETSQKRGKWKNKRQ